MASCLRRRIGLAWLATVAACTGHQGPPLRIVLAHQAVGSACYARSGAQTSDEALRGVNLPGGLTVATIRVTVRTHTALGDGGNFLCDRVLSVPRDNPSLRIPNRTNGVGIATVDIWGEAFAPLQPGDAAPRRVAVGALLGVPINARTLPDLRLYPDERFRCFNQRLSRPRAFHTATRLPNGQIFVAGGLTPSVDGVSDAFGAAPVFVAADAEVYDPVKGTFTKVVESGPAQPRAFHQAAYVGQNGDGKYQLLLVGGAAPPMSDPSLPAFDVNTGAAPGARIVPFDTSSSIINPLADAAAPAELVTYDPATNTATRAAFDGFTPGVFQGGGTFDDGLVVAGGIDWKGMPLTAMMIPQVKRVQPTRALETPRSGGLAAARIGPSVTVLTGLLSSDAALVWGGQITPTDPAGELATGLGAGQAVKLTSLALPSAPPTQFHSATLLPADSGMSRTILITGGFVATTMTMGQALQPPTTQAVRTLTVTPAGAVTQTLPMLSTYQLDATCSLANRYRPAGWESAVDIGRGRVLVSGGAPTVTGSCNDCDEGTDFHCATSQASLFAAGTLAPTHVDPDNTLERMQLARYGHTSTLMGDGNVILIGGVTAAGGAPRILADVEVYNPRPIVPLYDSSSGKPDPDDPIAGDAALAGTRAPGQAVSARTLCGEL